MLLQFIIFLILSLGINCYIELTSILYNKILNPNKIIIQGDITRDKISYIIKQIENIILSNDDNNIFMILDTDGGDLLEGLRLLEWIEQTKSQYKINYQCICVKAFSTGFNIFELCDFRYALNNCVLKTHEPIITIKGTLEFANNYFQNNFTTHLEKYNNLLDKITNRIGMNLHDYKEKINGKDWIIFNPTKIQKYNLADRIIYLA